jgi:chromosome segregation ATPase
MLKDLGARLRRIDTPHAIETHEKPLNFMEAAAERAPEPPTPAQALRLEFDRFTQVFGPEISRLQASLQDSRQSADSLKRRNHALTREIDAAREAERGLKGERDLLAAACEERNSEIVSLKTRLEKVDHKHRIASDAAAAWEDRMNALQSLHEESLIDIDQTRASLSEARRDLSELGVQLEQARAALAGSRSREAELEDTCRLALVHSEESAEHSRTLAEMVNSQSERLALHKAQHDAAEERIRRLESSNAELRAERDAQAKEIATLSAKLDETRRTADAKVHGLSKTKAFLWEMTEKQRKQITDQISRISRLESSNTQLSTLLNSTGGETTQEREVKLVKTEKAEKPQKGVSIQ